jgi:CYTH domain-containing protein
MKVVINTCFGGYGLSEKGQEMLKELTNGYIDKPHFLERHESVLIEIVEKLGDEANGMYAELKIVEIPDNVKYSIHEYDGNEHIDETWIEVTLDELQKGLSEEQLALSKQVTCIRIKTN